MMRCVFVRRLELAAVRALRYLAAWVLRSLLCADFRGLLLQVQARDRRLCGSSTLDDAALIENVVVHFPPGTSVKGMIHYCLPLSFSRTFPLSRRWH